MEKNVFQGFEGSVLDNSIAVKGGYFYRATGRAGAQVDEDYVTESGETDPWSGDTVSYNSIDQTWESCSG